MTDETDKEYEIIQAKPINKSGFCPVCGLFAQGFTTCPHCGGVRKVVKKQRRWIGGVEIP